MQVFTVCIVFWESGKTTVAVNQQSSAAAAVNQESPDVYPDEERQHFKSSTIHNHNLIHWKIGQVVPC